MLMTFLTIWKWENILSEKNCQRKCVEESFHRQCQHQCYRRSAPTESACTCAKNHSQSVYVFGSAIDIHTCKQRQHLESICIQWCNIRKTMLLADYKVKKFLLRLSENISSHRTHMVFNCCKWPHVSMPAILSQISILAGIGRHLHAMMLQINP